MTSVQADYLIKELHSGHPQLEDIEPHGTKVRLTLRPSVNLKTKSVIEILQQWVLIPACDVIYSETGKKRNKLDLKTPALHCTICITTIVIKENPTKLMRF